MGARGFEERVDEEIEVALLSVTFTLQYKTVSRVTEEIFEVFKMPSPHLQVLPFARAWIHQQSIEMGINPIVIPIEVCSPKPTALSKQHGINQTVAEGDGELETPQNRNSHWARRKSAVPPRSEKNTRQRMD